VFVPGLSRTSTVWVPVASSIHGAVNSDSGPHSVVPLGRRNSTSTLRAPKVTWVCTLTVPPAVPLKFQQFIAARAAMLPVWVTS